MKTPETLTNEELSQLAQAYLDGRLSRLEELELQLMLTDSEASTPAIDEARLSMAIDSLLSRSPRAFASSKRRASSPVWKWAAAAACLMLAAGAAFTILRSSELTIHPTTYCVYADGHLLSGAEARQQALETQRLSMLAMRETLDAARSTASQAQSSVAGAQNLEKESIEMIHNTIHTSK